MPVLSLSLPWWEFVLRGSVIFVVLLVLVRLSGKRVVGQFTPFDLIVLLIVSEAVSNALSGGDESLGGAMISAGTLLGLNFLASWAAARSDRAKAVLEGRPRTLGTDGRPDRAAMRSEHVAMADLEKRLREEGLELGDVSRIVLETDGQLSFVRRRDGGQASRRAD